MQTYDLRLLGMPRARRGSAISTCSVCDGQETLALDDEPCPEPLSTFCELLLRLDVLPLAFRCLDLDRGPPLAGVVHVQSREVVGRCPHVDDPEVPGQLEAVGDQLRWDQRAEPERVLV